MILRRSFLLICLWLSVQAGVASDAQPPEVEAQRRQAQQFLATAELRSSQHDLRGAVASFLAAGSIFRRIGDERGLQTVLNRVAVHYLFLADYAEALRNATDSVRLAERIGDKARLGQAHYTVAYIYRDLKELDLAMKYFKEAERYAAQAGDRAQQALALNEIGNLLMGRNDLEGALQCKERALELAKTSGDDYVMSACLHDLGLVLQEKKQYQEALGYFTEALGLDRKADRPREAAISLINIATIHQQLDQHIEAIRDLNEALPYAEKTALKKETAQILELLAESHSRLGRSQKAYEFLKRAKAIHEEIFTAERAQNIGYLQALYETERKDRENEILKRDVQIKDLELARERSQTNLLLIAAILVAIVAVALFHSNRLKSRTNEALAKANQAMTSQRAALDEANRRLDVLARTDYLTGLPNRLAMAERLVAQTAGEPATCRPFVLVLGDVDDFKTVNDQFGHHMGDIALVKLANKLRESIRADDSVGRWGGEEFLLILPDTDADSGVAVAERIHREITDLAIVCDGQEIRLTMTFGVVACDDPTLPIEEYLRAADRALYKGKNLGKNRVVISPKRASTQLDLPIHKVV
jgi:diguanylate cyclase (GGDEF)-like protein